MSEVNGLPERWRREALRYKAQVDEAVSKNLPHAQMTSAVTFLNQCAKELDQALKKDQSTNSALLIDRGISSKFPLTKDDVRVH